MVDATLCGVLHDFIYQPWQFNKTLAPINIAVLNYEVYSITPLYREYKTTLT